MLKRVLILFGNEANTENVLKTGKYLNERYGCEIKGLYVKDVRKHEIIPPSVEGLVVDTTSKYLVKEWDRFEDEQIKKLEDKIKECCKPMELVTREGITPDTALEEVKAYDLILLGKGKRVSSDLKYLLKYHYKPLLIVSDKEIDLDKTLIANDKGFRVNKCFFKFLDLFDDVESFDSISVGLGEEEDESIKEYLELTDKTINLEEIDGDEFEIIKRKADEHGALIMGDMTHSYLLEKITGHVGVKLIEELKIPIFIA